MNIEKLKNTRIWGIPISSLKTQACISKPVVKYWNYSPEKVGMNAWELRPNSNDFERLFGWIGYKKNNALSLVFSENSLGKNSVERSAHPLVKDACSLSEDEDRPETKPYGDNFCKPSTGIMVSRWQTEPVFLCPVRLLPIIVKTIALFFESNTWFLYSSIVDGIERLLRSSTFESGLNWQRKTSFRKFKSRTEVVTEGKLYKMCLLRILSTSEARKD